MAAANVVQPAVVGFPHHRIDGANLLIAGQREFPIHQRGGRIPDAQRVGKNDGRLDLAELVHLRRSDKLPEGVLDIDGCGDLVLKHVSRMRKNHGDAGADIVAVNDAYLADFNPVHVGNRVERARWIRAGMNAEVGGARPGRGSGAGLRGHAGNDPG